MRFFLQKSATTAAIDRFNRSCDRSIDSSDSIFFRLWGYPGVKRNVGEVEISVLWKFQLCATLGDWKKLWKTEIKNLNFLLKFDSIDSIICSIRSIMCRWTMVDRPGLARSWRRSWRAMSKKAKPLLTEQISQVNSKHKYNKIDSKNLYKDATTQIFGPFFRKIPKFSKAPERMRTRPDASERIRMHPNASEQVQAQVWARPETLKTLRKLRKTSRKLRKRLRNLRNFFCYQHDCPGKGGAWTAK